SNIDFEHRVNGNIDNMYIVFLVAIMIIAISCFNYVNLSNSLYADRLREFFVRKLHGATSSSLLKQYAGESFLLNLIGFALAFGFAVAFSFVNGQIERWIWNEPVFYLALSIVFMSSLLFSGILPAIAISLFDPLKFVSGEYS